LNQTWKNLVLVSLAFATGALFFSNCAQPLTAVSSANSTNENQNTGTTGPSAKAVSCTFAQKNPYVISKDKPLQFEVSLKQMKGFQYSCDNQRTWQVLDEEVVSGRAYSYFLPEGTYSCRARSQRMDNQAWELCSGELSVMIGSTSSTSPVIGVEGTFSHSTVQYGSFNLTRDSLVSVEEWKKFTWGPGQETQKTATVLNLDSPCIPGDLSCSMQKFPKDWGRNLNTGKGFILRVLVPAGVESVSLSFSTPNTFSRGQYGWLNVDGAQLTNALKCQMDNAEDPATACSQYVSFSEYQSSATSGFFSTFSGAAFTIRAKSDSSKAQYKYFVLFVSAGVTGSRQDNPLVFYGATVSAHLSDRAKFDQWRQQCADVGSDCIGRTW